MNHTRAHRNHQRNITRIATGRPNHWLVCRQTKSLGLAPVYRTVGSFERQLLARLAADVLRETAPPGINYQVFQNGGER